MSQGQTLLTAVKSQKPRNPEPRSASQRESAMMDMFAGPDRNKNIMLAVAVLAIAAIGILYAAGRLPGIF